MWVVTLAQALGSLSKVKMFIPKAHAMNQHCVVCDPRLSAMKTYGTIITTTRHNHHLIPHAQISAIASLVCAETATLNICDKPLYHRELYRQ